MCILLDKPVISNPLFYEFQNRQLSMLDPIQRKLDPATCLKYKKKNRESSTWSTTSTTITYYLLERIQ